MRTLMTSAARATLASRFGIGLLVFSLVFVITPGIIPALIPAFIPAGGATMTEPRQAQPYQYPGQMTQARVWVQNRGAGEAVPMDLREVNLDRPVPVAMVIGGAPVNASSPFPVKPVRPMWEYRTLLLKSDEDPASAGALAALGVDGWEVTGLAWPREQGTLILLKRPR